MEEIWNVIQIIAAGIITLGGAGGIIIGLYRWARKPNDNQNARLDKHDELLDKDNRRLNALEEWRAEKNDSERLIMKALYAMMQNSLDGTHTDKIKASMGELEEYLFNK